MIPKTTTTGYSLVEVLVAISVLLIAIVGPMTIAAQGIKTSSFSLEQNVAFFLAQEGIEAMFSLRGDYAMREYNGGVDSWSWIDDELNAGPCTGSEALTSDGATCTFGIDMSGGVVNLTPTTCPDEANEDKCLLHYNEANSPEVYTHDSVEPASPYSRTVTVEYYDDHVNVEVKVFWNSRVFGGQEQTVKLNTVLYDLLP